MCPDEPRIWDQANIQELIRVAQCRRRIEKSSLTGTRKPDGELPESLSDPAFGASSTDTAWERREPDRVRIC